MESALADQDHVSIIDVLMRMGLLASAHFEAWRKGRIEFLETEIQGSAKKLSDVLTIFHRLAQAKGLTPTETAFTVRTRDGVRNLQVTQAGDPAIEQFFRTTFVSPLGLRKPALTAAVTAAIRHIHTDYDSLLARGINRDVARERVIDRVQAILARWR